MKIETTIRLRGSQFNDTEKHQEELDDIYEIEEKIQALQSDRILMLQKLENELETDEVLCSFDKVTFEACLLENPTFSGSPLQVQIPGVLTRWVPFNEENLSFAIQKKFNITFRECYSDRQIRNLDEDDSCNCSLESCHSQCKGCK